MNTMRTQNLNLMGASTSLTLYPGMTGMTENTFINMKNCSSTITADLEIPQGGAEGVVLSQGAHAGGWSLYVKDGKPQFAYNWIGKETYTVAADQSLPAGKVTLRWEFIYDGGKPGAGGKGEFYINGTKVGEGPHREYHPDDLPRGWRGRGHGRSLAGVGRLQAPR